MEANKIETLSRAIGAIRGVVMEEQQAAEAIGELRLVLAKHWGMDPDEVTFDDSNVRFIWDYCPDGPGWCGHLAWVVWGEACFQTLCARGRGEPWKVWYSIGDMLPTQDQLHLVQGCHNCGATFELREALFTAEGEKRCPECCSSDVTLKPEPEAIADTVPDPTQKPPRTWSAGETARWFMAQYGDAAVMRLARACIAARGTPCEYRYATAARLVELHARAPA